MTTTVDRRNETNIVWSGKQIWGRSPNGAFTAAGVDANGNLNVNVQATTDTSLTVGTFTLDSNSSSSVALIAAGGVGIYNNLTSLTITNESSSGTVVSLSDNGAGGNVYKFSLAANGGIEKNYTIPFPQGTANAAWQVLNSAGVLLHYVGSYLAETSAV